MLTKQQKEEAIDKVIAELEKEFKNGDTDFSICWTAEYSLDFDGATYVKGLTNSLPQFQTTLYKWDSKLLQPRIDFLKKCKSEL